MHLIPTILLATALAAQAPSAVPTESADDLVYRCDFGAEQNDQNYDDWPDLWTRRRAIGYPHYLKIEIADDDLPSTSASANGAPNRALRIQLDGGSAAAFTAPIAISGAYSYVVRARLRTVGLKHNIAYVAAQFVDEDSNPLGPAHTSVSYSSAREWTDITIGPIAPSDPQMKSLKIALHVHPRRENKDLHGEVWFDDIHVARMPRMLLTSDRDHNIFLQDEEITFRCEVSGVKASQPEVVFELLDVNHQYIDSSHAPLLAAKPDADSVVEEGFSGEARWRPLVEDPGFYRLHVSVRGGSEELRRETTFVVGPPLEGSNRGEFGFSLPRGEKPLGFRGMNDLLRVSGVNWVKIPCWYSETDLNRADDLAGFAERLDLNGIRMVGVLGKPPGDQADRFHSEGSAIASLMMDPEVWQPMIDPIMSRLSLKVRWWQLGNDDDTSFVGLPGLEQQIALIKSRLERFGQSIQVGMAWKWLNEPPPLAKPPWEFLSMIERSPFTHEELGEYLSRSDVSPAVTWVTLRPLPRSKYELPYRVRDLVLRMLSAKVHRAKAVFVPNPFDDEEGLLHADGSPAELYAPWRTTALALANAEFLGSIELPSGSRNLIFSRDGEALMVVWNEELTQEVIYLGENVRRLDLWGKEAVPAQDGHRQVIEVGPMPVILQGVNESIAKWRMSVRLPKERLASVFGRDQSAGYEFQNTFPQGLGGRVTLHLPDVWSVDQNKRIFKAADGESLAHDFRVMLRNGASSGPAPIRIDFTVSADKQYEFSVYRTMHVGLGDVELKCQTTINENGELLLQQQLWNNTDKKVSFNCLLFAPGQRRQRLQVLDQARGVNTQTFRYRDGAKFIGQTLWLRAEEIDGERILNYHIHVNP